MTKIELLDIELLEDHEKLKKIDHWLKVMNWENGWHYDLDIIWILQYLEYLKLPRGSTILDAGAGYGVTQFILAESGYNVLSLDFADRTIPRRAERIFDIICKGQDLSNYRHTYKEFINYTQHADVMPPLKKALRRLKQTVDNPGKAISYIKQKIKEYRNAIYYQREVKRKHQDFGKITFLRGIFNDIPLPDCEVDLVVSVSAFEHNKYEDMPGSIKEFERILKPNALMLITTNAAPEKDWYHEPSQGWCLTEETLSRWFDIPLTEFNYDKRWQQIITSRKLKNRISFYYRYSSNNGLPHGDLSNAMYIPVGIVKAKR